MKPTAFELANINHIIDRLIEANVEKIYNGEIRLREWEDRYSIETKMPMYIDNGCTKAVFIIDDLPNWVIKIPYSTKTDFCKIETQVYELATKEGLEDNFAATYHVSTRGSMEFYIQEKVHCDCGRITDLLIEYFESVMDPEDYNSEEEYQSEVNDRANYGLTDIEAIQALFYDPDPMIKFLIYQNNINDFHSGNFGIRSDGKVILVDFSGF